MVAALQARAHSEPGAYPAPALDQVVWGKWYQKGAEPGSDQWRRVTGRVSAVTSEGLEVSWRGESGRGARVTPLSISQARQMLVRAGALAPFTLVQPQGAALVSHRVRVYWVIPDLLCCGVVRAYDSDSHEHQIVYDDGDVVWEMFVDAASYVVLD